MVQFVCTISLGDRRGSGYFAFNRSETECWFASAQEEDRNQKIKPRDNQSGNKREHHRRSEDDQHIPLLASDVANDALGWRHELMLHLRERTKLRMSVG